MEKNLYLVVIVIITVIMITGLTHYYVRVRSLKLLPLRLAKSLLSPETDLVEIFKDFSRISYEDLENRKSPGTNLLFNNIRQRLRWEINELSSFKQTYMAILDSKLLYQEVYPQLVAVCLEKEPTHWAEFYALAAEDDFSAILCIDQVVSQYDSEDKIKIYEEAIDKINLRLMMHFADCPLNETKIALQDLVTEFRQIAHGLKKELL